MGPRLSDTFGLRVRIDWGEADLCSSSCRILKRALVEGVRFLPFLFGEEDLTRDRAVVSRSGLDLAWDRAAVLDLPRARVAGLPLGVSDGELCASGKVGGCGSVTLDAAGVLTLEVGVEPDAERFVPARAAGGGMVAFLALVSRVKTSPSLWPVAMR